MEKIYSKEEQEMMLPVLKRLIPLVVKEIEEKGCKVLKIEPVVNEKERGYFYTVKLTNESIYFPHVKVCSVDFKKKEITEYADLYSCIYASNQLITEMINREEDALIDKEGIKQFYENCKIMNGSIVENVRMFDENDWNHFHDCLFDLTGKSYNREEMEKLFNSLPKSLQSEASQWGMSDTCWRDNFWKWFTINSNLNEEKRDI